MVGASWEGFVIENLINAAPYRTAASYYRTAAGAEIDLMLEFASGEKWAIEIKRSRAPKREKCFHRAREDIKPDKSFVVYAGEERYPAGQGVDVIGLHEITKLVAEPSA